MTDEGLRQRLGRSQRLRKRSGFLFVQQYGRRVPGRTLVVYAMWRQVENTKHPTRLGITVSKKVGKAVIRNRIKRWVRESYRRIGCTIDADVVVIAKPNVVGSSYQAMAQELRNLIDRAQVR